MSLQFECETQSCFIYIAAAAAAYAAAGAWVLVTSYGSLFIQDKSPSIL
jgi:hypothetical protein